MSYQPAGAYQPDFWTIGSNDIKYVDRQGQASTGSSTAYVANLALYVPFVINQAATVYKWWHVNGTLTTAYNIDFGIYNEDFTKVQSLGSTAGTTTASVVINTDWTDLTLAPGRYYMAFASDSTRNFIMSTDVAGLHQASGIMEQSTAFALPSPAVPVVMTRAFYPWFGMNLRSVDI